MDPAAQRIRDKLWYGKEAEQEVELEGGRTLRFHVACAGLWQVLRSALPR